MNIKLPIILVNCLFFFVFNTNAQFYSGSQMSFGKNRVQFGDNFWSHYRFSKYNVYFYKGGQDLAIYTAKYAHKTIAEIESSLDYVIETPIHFIVYNTLSDLKQSNIGLLSDEEYNIGGITHIVGTKVILYFDGNHQRFEQQIRAGIIEIMFNQMLYGEQIGSMIKNSALVSFPDWYIKGLISYFSQNWSTELDNYVRDGFISGKYTKFNALTGNDAIIAGHSLWYFIASKYGSEAVPNAVYISLMSRDIEDGFLYVLGVSYKNLIKEWMAFYLTRYQSESMLLDSIPQNHILKKIKKTRVYDQLKICPNSNLVAFTTNEFGKYKVWIYDLETKKQQCIFKGNYKLDQKIDHSFPLITWHPSGRLLSILVERKGSILLYYYQTYSKRVELFDKMELFHFEKITDFDYSFNGRYFVFSAVKHGRSDIYRYDIVSHTHEALTNDDYDDLSPRFINRKDEIVFSSNRNTSNLDSLSIEASLNPQKDFDLFVYTSKKGTPQLIQFTDTKNANEKQAMSYSGKHLAYLSDDNGIYNRYLGFMDSSISFIDTVIHYRYFSKTHPVTNYKSSILSYDVNLASRRYGEIFYEDGKYKMFVNRWQQPGSIMPLKLGNTAYRDIIVPTDSIKIHIDSLKKSDTKEKKRRFSNVYANEIDIDDYELDTNIFIQRKRQMDSLINPMDTAFYLTQKRNYNMEFNVSKLISQIDFSFLNNTYQPYTGGTQPSFINPGFNGLIKVGIADLFEDYRVTGGVRLSGTMENNEYILSFENLKHRTDKQLVLQRRGYESFDNFSIVKHKSHEARHIWNYPFDQVISWRNSVILRNDRAITLAIDSRDLQAPDKFKNWLGIKTEMVYDDTRERGMNIYFGSRGKVFAEYYRQINKNKAELIVLGMDLRNYQQIHKNFIWANRLAASTSLGSQKLIYYMGGVDNWMNFSRRIETFNSETPIDQDINWAYQTIATNMRGFSQNIRNGNSFALVNSELRFPVFSYFINRPIRSGFVRTFQIVSFGDVGTAWTSNSPYSENNSLFKKIFDNGPVKVTLNTLKDPIVYGYGFGVRSRLLGYFIRADWAWGIEDGLTLPAIFYLSLSLDF